MGQIDALLKSLGIAGLAANDVPIYDSVAGKFKKASGTPSSTTFLRGDGTWASPGSAGFTEVSVTISAANTDLAWPGGSALSTLAYVTTGGGSLRSLGAPTAGAGARIVFRTQGTAWTANNGGGVGAQLFNSSGANFIVHPSQHVEYIYDGGNWVMANYTNALPRIEAGTLSMPTGVSTVTFARAFVANPVVVAIVNDPNFGVGITSLSPSQVGLQHNSGGTLTGYWIAVGT